MANLENSFSSISYFFVVMRRIKIIYLLMFIISFSKAQVLINEYSAANFESYLDNYNEYEDWIELYNSSNNSVDLNGW